MYDDENSRTRVSQLLTSSPFQRRPRPQISPDVDNDLLFIKSKFPLLADLSDNFIRMTPLTELLKMQSTMLKMTEMDRSKDVEDKLSANKAAMDLTYSIVREGRDNRSTELHPARYLAGAGVSATRTWLNARKTIGLQGFPPIGNYDMASMGLAGVVTSKGWGEIHNPASTKISIKLFNLNNCSTKLKAGGSGSETEISDIGEFRLALRTLRTAMHFIHPWNMTIEAIESFFISNNYCVAETSNLERRAQILT